VSYECQIPASVKHRNTPTLISYGYFFLLQFFYNLYMPKGKATRENENYLHLGPQKKFTDPWPSHAFLIYSTCQIFILISQEINNDTFVPWNWIWKHKINGNMQPKQGKLNRVELNFHVGTYTDWRPTLLTAISKKEDRPSNTDDNVVCGFFRGFAVTPYPSRSSCIIKMWLQCS
jgi:hypothetical protein